MFKKLSIAIGVLGIAALCGGLAACSGDKPVLENYDVLVRYDANGGVYENRSGVSVADGFKFADYTADGEGTYRFKLSDPTSSARKKPVRLTKDESFFAGWYRSREIVLDSENKIRDASGRLLAEKDGNYCVVNEKGEFLDADGNVLIERSGEYYVVGTDDKSTPYISEPVYKYDGYWDFSKDTFECTAEGERELTLYAGWVPYYTFEYYVKQDNVWTKYGETNFDYKTTNEEGSKSSDYDTIWVPDWANGVMEHKHPYASSGSFDFPKIEGTTFVAAYTDEACTQKIEDSFTHPGTLDVAHAQAVNSVQKIYVEVENLVRYRIQTAEQLIANPNVNGYYTILNDLDFENKAWPSLFISSEFKGEFTAEEGKTCKISNAVATCSTAGEYCGLFGKLDKDAKVGGITFDNVTLKIVKTSVRQTGSIGAFAGEIEEGASVSQIQINGALMLGQIDPSRCTVNMLVGSGSKSGISVGDAGIVLKVFGEQLGTGDNKYYKFTLDKDLTDVDAEGNVSLVLAEGDDKTKLDKEIYDIKKFGGI